MNGPSENFTAQLAALQKQSTVTAAELFRLDAGDFLTSGKDRDPAIVLNVPITLEELEVGAPDQPYQLATNLSAQGLNAKPSLSYLNSCLHLPNISGVLPEADGQSTVLTHEALHALQCHVYNLDRFLRPEVQETWGSSVRYGHGPELEAILAAEETPWQTARRHKKLEKVASGSNFQEPEIYDLQYAEIQACLHQLISASGRSWRELPATPAALKAAFYGPLTGAKPHPAYPLATEDNCAASEALYELREKAVAKLSPTQRARFFDEALPAIYGDLLEFYGDPNGRVKMGLEPNPVYGRAFLQRVIEEGLQPMTNRWSAGEWEKLAEKVEPEVRPRLLEIAYSDAPDNLRLGVAGDALQSRRAPALVAPARRSLAEQLGSVLFDRVPRTAGAGMEAPALVLAR